MANPPIFQPGFNYSNWQATNPTKPLPAQQVDNDFANAARSVNQAISAIGDVRRSDGKLKNGIVGPDALAAQFSIGFSFEGNWAADQQYQAGDGVVFSQVFYAARVSHTSSVANQPPDSGTWTLLFSLDDIVVAGALSMPAATFLSDGVTTDFNLGFAPISNRNLFVTIGGQIQEPSEYSVNGNTLTFATAPPTGPLGEAYTITARGFATTATLVTPADGSITPPKLASSTTALFATAAQGLKADAAMPKSVYDPNAVGQNAFGWRSPFQKNVFKMELFGVRASQWPDYAAALALYGTTNFYTQWFCVDEDRDLAFYLRQPGADANNYGWMVVVEKFSTGVYQTCFRLGVNSRGPCWIEKISGQTYFVSGNGADLRGLGKWNVTTLPTALSTLAPAITVPPATTDNYVYGNYRNGVTSLNSYTPNRGGARDLQQFKMFDASYNLIDTIDFPISVTSTLTEPGQDYFPHVQGYALGDNYHMFTYGARWRTDGSDGVVRVRKYAGTRVVSMDGTTVLAEGMIRPDFFIQKLQAKGVVCERLEGEGLWISRDGTAYALYVTRATSDGVSDGIVILKLFSQSDSAMDMSGGAVSAYSGPPERTGPVALVNRQVINRMTSVQFATLNDILDHMLLLKLPYFSFTSGYDIGDMFVPGGFVDLNGQTFNALMRVELYMLDAGEGGKFHMVTRGSGRGPRDWTIAGTTGSRTQSLQKRPNFKAKITGQTVTPGSDVLLAFDNAVRVAGSCYDASVGNYKFTPRDGLCSMGFAIQVDTGLVVSATVDLKIFKNGASWASYRHIVQATSGQSFVMPDVEDDAALGDYYQAYVNFGGAGNKVLYTAELRSWFKGHNFE